MAACKAARIACPSSLTTRPGDAMNLDAAHSEAATTAPNTTPSAISTLLPRPLFPQVGHITRTDAVRRARKAARRNHTPVSALPVSPARGQGTAARRTSTRGVRDGNDRLTDGRRVRSPSRDRLGGRRAVARVPGADKKKRAFVVPGTIFFLSWFFGFIILAGYAPDFMGREFITDGITVGYALALSQFLMVWGLGWWYLRKADREFDPSPSAPPRWRWQPVPGSCSRTSLRAPGRGMAGPH